MPRDNRAALLRAARDCLEVQGYARTTARDVAAAAGVSLSAIGYHFGTVDALLLHAITSGIDDWGDQLRQQLESTAPPPGTPLPERLHATWGCVLASFPRHRGVLLASYELIATAEQSPEMRERLRATLVDARRGLARQLHGVDAASEPARAERVGALCYALLSGLMVQWLVDPTTLPDAGALTDAMLDVFTT